MCQCGNMTLLKSANGSTGSAQLQCHLQTTACSSLVNSLFYRLNWSRRHKRHYPVDLATTKHSARGAPIITKNESQILHIKIGLVDGATQQRKWVDQLAPIFATTDRNSTPYSRGNHSPCTMDVQKVGITATEAEGSNWSLCRK
jgi:hypothetical protein